MQKCSACFGEDVVAVSQVSVDVQPPSAFSDEARTDEELCVDRHRMPVAHEDPGGHGGEAVPGRQQPARLVERGRDHPAVCEPGPALVPLVEAEVGLILAEPLLTRQRELDSEWIVAAAPTRGIVVGRDAVGRQRRPPRSWCALKKFSEPAVAMAAEAEISSASAAAATIWAKR